MGKQPILAEIYNYNLMTYEGISHVYLLFQSSMGEDIYIVYRDLNRLSTISNHTNESFKIGHWKDSVYAMNIEKINKSSILSPHYTISSSHES